MDEKTRCFIAIDLPREIVNEIERIQNELKKKNNFTGKFVEGENLHLTLKFLGEVDEKQINEVKKKLEKVKPNKFMAYLGELGVFSSNFIRIIWVHVLGKQILELQKEIDESLKELFEPEKRFMSHLTIARVKDVKDRKIFLDELKKIKTQNIGFEVREFYLMKSELKPDGPVYSVLEKFDLSEKI
jgi:2'-5' RNA ligase